MRDVIIASFVLLAVLLLVTLPGTTRVAPAGTTAIAAEAAAIPANVLPPRDEAQRPAEQSGAPESGRFVVRVQVHGPAGEPVEGASVFAFDADAAHAPRAARAMSATAFELGCERPGSYWLTAIAPGWSAADPQSVMLDDSSAVSELALQVQRMAVVRGQARWTDGRAVSGASFVLVPQVRTVDAGSARTRAQQYGERELPGRTASDGSFMVCGATPGLLYRLELSPDAERPESHQNFPDIEASKGPIELRVDPAAIGGAR